MSTAAKPAPFGPDLRSALVAMVRKKVPESEVEDIVQSALAEAIASPNAPTDSESLRRWIFGVAKNKVVDYHRRAGRESFELPDVAGTPAPHVEADLLRWAERNLPEGDENQKTLDWMIREGEGEKLESIAASEKLPPPRVRQRVSRLRRHFKENWQREVALLAALGVIISAIAIFVFHKPDPEPITHDPVHGDPRAEPIRRLALEKCAAADWKPCVEGLDDAKRLDPAGDSRPEVKRARQAADDAAKSAPAPTETNPTTPPLAPSAAPLPTTAPPDSSGSFKMQAPTKPDGTTPPIPTPSPKVQGKKAAGPAKPTPNFGGSDFGDSIGGGSGTPAAPDTKEPTKEPPPRPAVKGGGKTATPFPSK